MGFSGLWVVWSPLGAPGEKKRENQMYLQDLHPSRDPNLQNFANFRIWSGAKVFESCRYIWFSLFFSPGAPRRLQTTNGPENPVSLLENQPFEKYVSKIFLV